ncbi:Protein of unknown function DUF1666 protein [Actinidia chinensis var. chinensis]|uniref:Uncharacterized protein n=1 Tax=Actinidia chinensis var. chinensis TaxID=1590841 RepID=A0A2R6RYP4_ACTCC|nr:Protein of unknown function DUF1666 protein [Actinidia chinensis var. chinensis]
MALLTSCWFIIEAILIREGLLKWFFLSFYIHPLLLFLCQIFLWAKLLQRWLLLFLSLAIRITLFVISSIFRFFSSTITSFSFTRRSDAESVNKVEVPVIPRFRIQNQIADSYSCLNTVSTRNVGTKVYELRMIEFEEESDYMDGSILVESTIKEQIERVDEDTSLKEYVDMTECSLPICDSISQTDDAEMKEYSPSMCSSNSPVVELELVGESREEDLDSFYPKYAQGMRWFDLINHERTCGISAILNKQLPSSCSFESTKPVEFSIPYISWSKMARRRLLRSLESDFELVYVAQSCLSWEALHYQYRKVEALACTSFQNGAFYENVVAKFQKFQILLERFMEDERCEGKRHWNYVQRRLSSKSLLQVPQVSGYMEEREDGARGEAMRATEVLKGIEKCIKAFWLYVQTDQKKPQWKFKSFLWPYPPVEDPRDLQLLADLTKTLQKELWLKDLRGKKRCWLKRVINPIEESQKKELLFTMIDMKLVSRVLKMSKISTSQLKWCQHKLDNIEFKEGKVLRAYPCSLFPSS